MAGFKNVELKKYHYEPETKTVQTKGIKRVAAYARVSTLHENQEDSFETQCAYYEHMIGSDPRMVLVGVYGDQGISGLGTKKRTEFARMMADCRDGKVDVVITRSISRLSRNMQDCVKLVQELKGLGIPVIFEKENINSMDPNSELFFHIFSALAQEESNSLSKRIKWALDKRAEIGDPAVRPPYGYGKKDEWNEHRGEAWYIKEPEAKRIRLAFSMAAELHSYQEIETALNEMERQENSGYIWKRYRLRQILTNERYRGDILTNKNYYLDYVTKKMKRNRGERVQYYIEGHHEPIIPAELFDKVQSIVEAGMLHSGYHLKREKYKKEKNIEKEGGRSNG